MTPNNIPVANGYGKSAVMDYRWTGVIFRDEVRMPEDARLNTTRRSDGLGLMSGKETVEMLDINVYSVYTYTMRKSETRRKRFGRQKTVHKVDLSTAVIGESCNIKRL